MARRWRSFLTFAGICPGIFAARDPSSREYLKIPSRSNRVRSRKSSSVSNSTSVSPRNSGTQLRDQIFDMGPGGFTPHPEKHGFVNVLQRDVDVTRHVPAFGDG